MNAVLADPSPTLPAAPLAARLAAVRSQTLALASPLSEADCQVQSMPDASPVKWHLAHTTWFFETFVLAAHTPDFAPFDPSFRVLFNSYYQGVGRQHPRPQRGLITRPDLATVRAYRASVDQRLATLLQGRLGAELAALVELGLQHEQQHQELILTDVLHLLSCNPLAPAYRQPVAAAVAATPLADPALHWVAFDGGLVAIGHDGPGFAFDNEGPRHGVHLRPYALASRPVSQGDFADFVADGGYAEPRWWMSAGWDWVQSRQVQAPACWTGPQDRGTGRDSGPWQVFGLHGLQPMAPDAPMVHLSWFEADAYARWYAAQHPGHPPTRLPTEAEWEHAAHLQGEAAWADGPFLEDGRLQPVAAGGAPQRLRQMMGGVWEWTASPYTAYPGYRPWTGAVGEYNGKFMVNQMVLRGGSFATPRSHLRTSYRNFFPTDARWQFSGCRLARDAG